jgi:hypothetical protein
MRESSSNVRSLFIIFFVLTLAFSLTSSGIINGNTTLSITAYAKKSEESSDGNSNAGTSGGGDNWEYPEDLEE